MEYIVFLFAVKLLSGQLRNKTKKVVAFSLCSFALTLIYITSTFLFGERPRNQWSQHMHTIPLFNGQDSFCGFPLNQSPPLDHPPKPNLTMVSFWSASLWLKVSFPWRRRESVSSSFCLRDLSLSLSLSLIQIFDHLIIIGLEAAVRSLSRVIHNSLVYFQRFPR